MCGYRYHGVTTRSAGGRDGGEDAVEHTVGGGPLELELGPQQDPMAQGRLGHRLDLIGGDDVGNTPIFGVTDEDGVPMALYGPVLTKRPDAGRSLALWDAIVETTTNQAFAGLNRKTPELPDFG